MYDYNNVIAAVSNCYCIHLNDNNVGASTGKCVKFLYLVLGDWRIYIHTHLLSPSLACIHVQY